MQLKRQYLYETILLLTLVLVLNLAILLTLGASSAFAQTPSLDEQRGEARRSTREALSKVRVAQVRVYLAKYTCRIYSSNADIDIANAEKELADAERNFEDNLVNEAWLSDAYQKASADYQKAQKAADDFPLWRDVWESDQQYNAKAAEKGRLDRAARNAKAHMDQVLKSQTEIFRKLRRLSPGNFLRRADLSQCPPPTPPSGVYLAMLAGVGTGESRWDEIGSSTGTFNISGPLVGLAMGFDTRLGEWSAGVEADVSLTRIRGETTVGCAGTCQTANSLLSTVRGRIGREIDSVFPYFTAGLALGNIRADVRAFPGNEEWHAGIAGGVGLEVARISSLRWRIEVLHVRLSDGHCTPTTCGGSANIPFQATMLRAGLVKRFN